MITDHSIHWETEKEIESRDIAFGDITNIYHLCGAYLFGQPLYCPDCEGKAEEERGCRRYFVFRRIYGDGDVG